MVYKNIQGPAQLMCTLYQLPKWLELWLFWVKYVVLLGKVVGALRYQRQPLYPKEPHTLNARANMIVLRYFMGWLQLVGSFKL